MASPPNPQQLLLVKSLFEEAQALAQRHDTFSTSKAILFLDLAVEQMMRSVVSSLDPNVSARHDLVWHQLWEKADAALQTIGKQLHNRFPLKNLHDQRNLVQHAGATYHSSQALPHVAPVEDMLSNAFMDVYGLDFARYNLLALIANEDLRSWLQTTEELLSEGKAISAVAACKHAHNKVIAETQQTTRSHRSRRRINLRGLDVRDLSSLLEAFEDIQEQMERSFAALEQEVVAIGVGLSILEARQFRAFGAGVGVSEYSDGQLSIVLTYGGTDATYKAGAEFMLDYLSRLIRSIEQTYGKVLGTLTFEVPLKDQQFVKGD